MRAERRTEARCPVVPNLSKAVPRRRSAAKFGGVRASRAERPIADGGVKKAANPAQPRITRRHLARVAPAASPASAARRRPSGRPRRSVGARRPAPAVPGRGGGATAAPGPLAPLTGSARLIDSALRKGSTFRGVRCASTPPSTARRSWLWRSDGRSAVPVEPRGAFGYGRRAARARGARVADFAPTCARSVSVAHSGGGLARRGRTRRREERAGGETGAARALHCSFTTASRRHAGGMRVSEEMAE